MEKNLGNDSLISTEEERVAKLLRERYLQIKNETALPVYPKKTFYTRVGKRILDLMIAIPVCIIALPINLILAVCVFFDVGTPIFYKQTRVGRNGKHFVMSKFRSMNDKKDADGRLLPAAERVTKFGKIMRKFSLDELWNFWYVLKGDMSVIGPRPLPVFVYDRMCERHKMCTITRPGLECPRVIHVPGEEICRIQRTYENNIWYVENESFLLDCKLVFLLIKMALSLKRRNEQATGEGLSYFVGYDADGIAISLNSYKKYYAGDKRYE